MRLFLLPNLRRAHLFHGLAVAGALAVSAVVSGLGSTPVVAVALWLGLIVLGEAATTAVNARMARRPPPDARLARWAAVKTATSAGQGLAWAMGPVLLHVPGEAVSVLAPAWAIITVTVGIIYACASWPACLHIMAAAANLPAALALLAMGGTVEVAVAVCMAVSLGFALVIGTLAIRNTGDLIVARLDTADLLARQVDLTRRLAVLNADRTRFFSAASHDLRQPLQALGFYTSLLSVDGGRTAQPDLIARLVECVDTLDRQFNAILGVAQTDAAVGRAVARPVAVAGVLDRVAQALRPDAQVKGLALRMVPTAAAVQVPPEVLERVLINLLANAVRYTRQGGVLLGVRRRGDHVAVTVADTGIGIPEAELPRIFDDYFQVANPERNSLSGFGLGLAIVKRLADGMGWQVTVRSVPGRGSVFSVLVPRALGPVAEPRAEPPQALPAGLAVLVVDDDPLVRDATVQVLAALGIPQAATGDAGEALRLYDGLVARHGGATVLLDFRLGAGVTGLDLADRLRARPGPAPRLILVTAETDPQVLAAARARGMIVLGKPLKPIRLRAALTAAAAG
jgi:signal transduction histidine kinase